MGPPSPSALSVAQPPSSLPPAPEEQMWGAHSPESDSGSACLTQWFLQPWWGGQQGAPTPSMAFWCLWEEGALPQVTSGLCGSNWGHPTLGAPCPTPELPASPEQQH